MCKPLLTFCILNAHLNVIQELDDTCLVRFSGLSSACWWMDGKALVAAFSCIVSSQRGSHWPVRSSQQLHSLLSVKGLGQRQALCVHYKKQNTNWTMTDTQQPDGLAWRAVLNSDEESFNAWLRSDLWPWRKATNATLPVEWLLSQAWWHQQNRLYCQWSSFILFF